MTATFAATEDPDTLRNERLLKAGKRVGIVGLVVLLVGGAILGTGLFKMFKGLSQTRERLTVEVAVPGDVETHLEPGTYDVVAIGRGLTESVNDGRGSSRRRTRTSVATPTVVITDLAGTPVEPTGSVTSFRYSNNDYELVSMGSFRVATADTYRIEVTGAPGGTGSFGSSGQVTSIGVGPTDGSNSGWMALGGGLLFGLGILVTVAGVGLYVTGRTRRSRHRRTVGSSAGWGAEWTAAPGSPPYGGHPHVPSAPSGWSPPPPPPPPAPGRSAGPSR